jgi:D-alanyl-D-alanine carboxypeptidase (penicillin-binding protein 5/6)
MPRSCILRSVVSLSGIALLLTGCGDPERETRLQWREEEVNAKELDVVRRERLLEKDKHEVDNLRMDLEMREKALAARKIEIEEKLAAELEKTAAARRELEMKELRGPVPQISAGRVIVIDPATDEVLFEKESNKRGPIASTQKLLTALLVCEKGNLDQIVTVEHSDTQCAPVRFGLNEGDKYSRRQLLTALLVKSSNDIAQALARDNAGSVEAFVEKMNAKADELGLENSFFVNPHGLPDEEEQYSTAIDLSKIAKAADQVDDIRAMIKLQTFKFERNDGKVVELANTNRVLRSCGYCDGMKTGYTNASGYCLVASGEKNGKRRIVVVLNDTSSGVWRDAQALLEWSLKA